VLAALTALGFLFMRSVKDTRETPYTVERVGLDNWTLALESDPGPNSPLLVLRPPARLASGLYHQLFARMMESFDAPAAPAIPLLLRGEFDVALAGRLTPEAVLDVAKGAGLNAAAFSPRCLAHRRVSDPQATQQLYFVLFDAPAFQRFRARLAAMPAAAAGAAGPGTQARAEAFDPAALSPVLFVASAQTRFSRWLPLRADPKTDCVAPITILPA
jgi:hypothetical protein